MSDAAARLTAIKAQQAQAVRRRVQAEARMETAAAKRANVLGLLAQEYGCSTVEEAQEKLAALEAEVTTKLNQVEQALKELT